MPKNQYTSRRCLGCGGLIPAKRKVATCSPRCGVAARSARGKDRMPKHAPGNFR